MSWSDLKPGEIKAYVEQSKMSMKDGWKYKDFERFLKRWGKANSIKWRCKTDGLELSDAYNAMNPIINSGNKEMQALQDKYFSRGSKRWNNPPKAPKFPARIASGKKSNLMDSKGYWDPDKNKYVPV